jgi:D-serine deaminase-like pyridoxal phosphate-dependent protein
MQVRELGPWAKSFPASSWGMPRDEFVASSPRLSEFGTPLLTIDAGAESANVSVMADWASQRGVDLAPHGKTTMAPRLWQHLLDAGAWGITLATMWQVQVARAAGVHRILLANEVVDPVALGWLSHELQDPEFEFVCWVDSVAAVDRMRAGLADASRPVSVLLEVGAAGGRTGARGLTAALDLATAIEAAPELHLAGVGGYEGSYGADRSLAATSAVESYLDGLVAVHDAIDWVERPILSAGGSAYPDLVAERLVDLTGTAQVILRAGAYQLHDEGFYGDVSPIAGLRSAIHGWARVVSTPEPGLAILDGGKRDFPYDLGLPTTAVGPITKVNDQHAYVAFAAEPPTVGEVLRLALSHPCTALDKWRLIPVIDSADAVDPVVVDLVDTYF